MKILQITNKPPYPDIDGGTIAVLNLTKGLALNGHEITILSMNTAKHRTSLSQIPDELRKVADFRFVDVPAHISMIRAALNLFFSDKPYNAVRFITENFRKSLTALLKEKEFDIIQLEGLYVCPYIPDIRNFSKAKIAYRAHNVEFEIWQRSLKLNSGLRRWYLKILANRIRKFELFWLNQYDFLIPITPRDKTILTGFGNLKPSFVIPAGLDLSLISASKQGFEFPSLFHLGSLEWSPNQEGILWFLKHCWPDIHSKNPDLKFYIAGRNAPIWLVERLNLPGVVYLGEIPDARSFIQSKAIMVVPLFSGSGMRVKIIEAMSFGKAIVSTSIGAEGLSVQHGKNILIADDKNSFIEAIRKLITNKELCAELGKESRFFIQENFDHIAWAKKLSLFYQKNLK